MSLSLLARRAPTTKKVSSINFRPRLETLEDRAVPANLLDITGVNFDALSVVDGVLRATDSPLDADDAVGTVTGTLAGLPFTAEISDFALQLIQDDPDTPELECPVLSLELAPIDIDLLGLHVDTSAICLDVTATPGGGLLGDLLCGLAGGLPGTIPLGLNDAVGDILDAVLDGGINSAGDPPAGAEDICDGECEILDLALGPVDLSLLGLNVSLDNCEDPEGPVQVCVSASEGEGLLGDLLCGLADGGLLGGTIDRITGLIGRLGDLADRLDQLPDVGRIADQVERLTDQLERLAGRVDSIRDLDRFLDRVEHTIERLDRLIDRL